MASIGVIFTSTYHTKQLNLWPNSSASRVVNYNQLYACQGDMQSFWRQAEHSWSLTSLSNKPQQTQPRKFSASMPGWIVSQHVQLLFDGENCVLLLCAWKPAFLKSSMLHSVSVSGISVDSAPAMQALWSKGIELDSHPPIHTMFLLVIINAMMNLKQLALCVETNWASVYKLIGQVVDLKWLYLLVQL